MARRYVEVAKSSGRDTNEGITDIHVVTGYGGPVHLVVSGDSQELVDKLTDEVAHLLEDHLVVQKPEPTD
jgi:hypothetical protein